MWKSHCGWQTLILRRCLCRIGPRWPGGLVGYPEKKMAQANVCWFSIQVYSSNSPKWFTESSKSEILHCSIGGACAINAADWSDARFGAAISWHVGDAPIVWQLGDSCSLAQTAQHDKASVLCTSSSRLLLLQVCSRDGRPAHCRRAKWVGRCTSGHLDMGPQPPALCSGAAPSASLPTALGKA